MKTVSLSLREQDFTVTRDVAAAINHEFGKDVATAVDSRRVDLNVPLMGGASVPYADCESAKSVSCGSSSCKGRHE